jgi:hypothetical protein
MNKEFSFNEVISTKPIEVYSREQIKDIKILSVDKNALATPFGSAAYRVQKYPGDLDLYEYFYDCCTVNDVTKKFAKKIQTIAKQINKERVHYFSEFKAGIDERYNIDIGTLMNGIYTYRRQQLLAISNEMVQNNLLSLQELNIIKNIMKVKNPGGDEYDMMNYVFRNRRILRWSSKEIIQGYKLLPAKKKITLQKALEAKSHVKIDMISFINGKFVEVTNFWILVLIRGNKLTTVNFNFDYFDNEQSEKTYDNQIRDEIQKLYYSNMYYSPFKMAKRMWAYSRFFKLEDFVYKLLPLVTGNISYMYSITSEMDAILRIFEVSKSIPINAINNQIDQMKNRLSNILQIDNPDLDILATMINTFTKTSIASKKIKLLTKIKKYLKTIVNINTIKELEILNMNPPPRQFLPNVLMYTRIVRTPYENVSEPIYGGAIGPTIYRTLSNTYRHNFCNGRARPLLGNPQEYHPLCANFEGPHTHISDPYVRNYPPYNNVDAAARTHDIDYENASKLLNVEDQEHARRIADDKFLNDIEKYPNEEPYYSIGKYGIGTKVKAENIVPGFVKLIAPTYFGKK